MGVQVIDAVVVGSGPNGLSAAIALARAGHSVVVLEAEDTAGGGVRSAELTLPGFVHDVCSTIHPLAASSPFLRSLELQKRGVSWRESEAPLAHVLDEENAITLERSLKDTSSQLGVDAACYEDLMTPFVEHFDDLVEMFLGPLRFPKDIELGLAFGRRALLSMNGLARPFQGELAPALLAGSAAHAMLPLSTMGTAAFALILSAAGHAIGWPVAEGGSVSITNALIDVLREAGGEIRLGHRVRSIRDLPPARTYLFDLMPRQLVEICGEWLSPFYRRRVAHFRHGPGVFKIDWALSEAVPWTNERCRRATTVHLSGNCPQLHAAEQAVSEGKLPREPFLLFTQPCIADPSRAPAGQQTGWAYCHVPPGSTEPLTELIESYVERFAPGLRDIILARHTRTAREMEQYNPNYVGGDINGGAATLDQLFFRPIASLNPYATSNPRVFLCSSATPPGGGVHGLCGYFAAQAALRRLKSS